MPEDIVQKHGDVYAETAPAVLGEQHPFLIESLENHNKIKKNKSILVIGPSKWVLPYSYDPERVGKIIGDGKLVLMDYTDEMVEGAMDFLEKIEFDKKSGLELNRSKLKQLNPILAKPNSISFVKGNLKDRLPFPDNSFDCIDATLVAHHVIPYMENLENVAKELYRVIVPGGLLHYGTGDVDMDSESKLVRTLNDLQKYFKKEIIVIDQRDGSNGYITKAIPNNKRMKIVNDSTGYDTSVFLTDEGNLIIPAKNRNELLGYLKTKGYSDVQMSERSVIMPLIDQKKDRGFINDVKGFYSAICNRTRNKGLLEETIQEHEKAVSFEESNALKGIVEYYKSFGKIQDALKKAGFESISRKIHKEGPFYNITAHKTK